MSFNKTGAYWTAKIENIDWAIRRTAKKIQTLTEERQIDAHLGYMESLKKEKEKAILGHGEWQEGQA